MNTYVFNTIAADLFPEVHVRGSKKHHSFGAFFFIIKTALDHVDALRELEAVMSSGPSGREWW